MASGTITLRSPVSSQYTLGLTDNDSIKCNGTYVGGQTPVAKGYIRRIGNLIIFSFYVKITTALAANHTRILFNVKDYSLWPDALETNEEIIHTTISHSTSEDGGTITSYDLYFDPSKSSSNMYVRTPMPVGYVSGTMVWTIGA